MGLVRIAFTRAIQDWWYALINLAVINLIWFACVVTVVAGPPATAALLVVARDAAVGQGAEFSSFFAALRRLFWRAWKLGIVTALGTVMLIFDIYFYADRLNGTGVLYTAGIVFLLYVLVIWIELQFIAWPLLVDRPEMQVRHVLRNSAVVTLRMPGASFLLFFLVAVLTVVSVYLAPFVALALGAVVALMVQHYLHLAAPTLANFPPRPGEGFPDAPPVSAE